MGRRVTDKFENQTKTKKAAEHASQRAGGTNVINRIGGVLSSSCDTCVITFDCNQIKTQLLPRHTTGFPHLRGIVELEGKGHPRYGALVFVERHAPAINERRHGFFIYLSHGGTHAVSQRRQRQHNGREGAGVLMPDII